MSTTTKLDPTTGSTAQLVDQGFAIFSEELFDGSIVYGVRFHCDYDPERRVEIDCVDKAHAEAIVEALRDGASNIEVSE